MRIYRISTDIRSKEFKDWFGDWEHEDAYSSKNKNPIPSLATELGKSPMPRTFYHGTTNQFDNFEVGRKTHNSNVFGTWETTRNAIFFTPDSRHANAFTSKGGDSAGGNIRPVYLNVRSPLDFSNGVDNSTLDEFEEKGISRRWLVNFSWAHLDDEDGKTFVDAAKELGYDGVIFNDENPDTRENMETWAVFDANQIRPVFA